MGPKRALTAAAFAAVALAGCGGAVRVQPTTPAGSSQLASRGRVDSPVKMKNHLACLRDAHLAVQVLSSTQLRIGAAPAGPTIVFTPTPGAAQAEQIGGKAEAAEVIGSALVYPNQGSDGEMATIGACLAQGVQG
jgi:hypothetical protein